MTFILFLSLIQTVLIFTPFFRFGYFFSFVCVVLLVRFLPCMAMYDCVGLCRAMYGYVWLCRVVYGYVGLCMAMYDYVGLCMAMYGYVWLCMAM